MNPKPEQFGTLGKPALGRDHSVKWTYEQFVTKITLLEQKVQGLEIAIADLEIDCAQVRRALAGAQAELLRGMTQNPFPFNAEMQKVWDAASRGMKDQGLKKVGNTAPKLNWDKDKTIPY